MSLLNQADSLDSLYQVFIWQIYPGAHFIIKNTKQNIVSKSQFKAMALMLGITLLSVFPIEDPVAER